MEWYNILSIIVGSIGGIGGIVTLYHAKPQKDSIEIANMKEMLDEAHKLFSEVKGEKSAVQQELTNYKEETMRYISEFKERFSKVEKRLDNAEGEVRDLKGVIYHGYRCPFPPNIKECPVVAEYETKYCNDCKGE